MGGHEEVEDVEVGSVIVLIVSVLVMEDIRVMVVMRWSRR